MAKYVHTYRLFRYKTGGIERECRLCNNEICDNELVAEDTATYEIIHIGCLAVLGLLARYEPGEYSEPHIICEAWW